MTEHKRTTNSYWENEKKKLLKRTVVSSLLTHFVVVVVVACWHPHFSYMSNCDLMRFAVLHNRHHAFNRYYFVED